MYTPRIGRLIFFSGDKRKVQALIDNVTTFSSTSDVLKNGDSDITSTYISDNPTSAGNLFITATIGDNASIPPGNYRYFVTGVHSGKTSTWYFDLLVLAKDLSQIPDEIPEGDYDPFLGEVLMYEGDVRNLTASCPSLDLVSATGVLKLGDSDVTATYCNGSVSVSGDTVTSHNLGALATIPAGEYGYFVSLTHSNSEIVTTYYWKITILPKQSIV